MTIQVNCPHCSSKLRLALQNVRRDQLLYCAHCAAEIPVSGPFLTEVFWAANNLSALSR